MRGKEGVLSATVDVEEMEGAAADGATEGEYAKPTVDELEGSGAGAECAAPLSLIVTSKSEQRD